MTIPCPPEIRVPKLGRPPGRSVHLHLDVLRRRPDAGARVYRTTHYGYHRPQTKTLRHRRHDALARLIAGAAQQLHSASVDTSERLCSSTRDGKKVDIVIRTFHLPPFVLAIDVTVSCPLLPSYVAKAATSAAALFDARAAEKNAKHLPGCTQLGRAFMPFVMTTLLGIGPRPARSWLDSLFSAAYAQELASGGTGCDTAHRRLVFIMSLQASAVRSTAHMVTTLLEAARTHAASAASMAATVAATAPTAAAAAPTAVDPARPRTTVVHCRNAPPAPDTYDVYIGRGIGTTNERWGRPCLWGNGFKIQGRNTTTARQTAANRHREWLHRPEQADLRAAVRRELRGLRLGCWCEQPGPCHGHNLCAVADADFDAGGDSSTL